MTEDAAVHLLDLIDAGASPADAARLTVEGWRADAVREFKIYLGDVVLDLEDHLPWVEEMERGVMMSVTVQDSSTLGFSVPIEGMVEAVRTQIALLRGAMEALGALAPTSAPRCIEPDPIRERFAASSARKGWN